MRGLREDLPALRDGVAPPSGTIKRLVLADVRRAAHSRKRILAELAKCELVCANCHRERTFGSRNKRAA